MEVDDVVKLKLPISGGTWPLVARNRHSLAGHLRAASHQQVAGARRDGPSCVAAADRATEAASPGCLRSGHMQGRLVGADRDLTADCAACSVYHGGPLLSDTHCQQDLTVIMDPKDCRDQGLMALKGCSDALERTAVNLWRFLESWCRRRQGCHIPGARRSASQLPCVSW